MENLNVNWSVLMGVFVFLLVVMLLISFSNNEKKKKQVEINSVVDPPQDHLDFLVDNYGYDLKLAEEMWGVIREPGADAGFLAVQIYARKLYVEWYLKLSKAEQAGYEWKMRGSDLIQEIEKHPEYWNHLPRIISFIKAVRSYTG